MLELMPHQSEAIQKMHNGSILCGDVGSGKTLTSLAYFMMKEARGGMGSLGKVQNPMDVYVITTAKKRDSGDWEHDAMMLGLSTVRENSLEGMKLTVDSWNNIERYLGVKDAFFIFDEQRVVGSGAWSQSFIKIAHNNRWVLLSATPGDNWLDYIPVFVANGWYKNRTQFKREHVVYSAFTKYPKVERYVNVPKLEALKKHILVEMPFDRHTNRIEIACKVAYDKTLVDKVWTDRWHVYDERPLRDVSELFSVSRKVVNSDPSRLETVRGLMSKHPRLIVFYNFDYELELLRTLGSGVTSAAQSSEIETSSSYEMTDVQIAEWNGHKHEPVPTSERWVYLVQYTAGSEGWNCVETNATVFYSQTYSYKQHHQAHGRIDRLNTPYTDLYYYTLRSDAWIDKAIRKSLSSKKSFNERSYAAKAA